MGGQSICWCLLAAGGASLAPSGYGWALLRMLAALVLVCVLAALSLRWIARRMGRGQASKGLLRVIERCPLTSRQSLWLVEASGHYFLLGSSDSGVTRLAELDPGSLAPSCQPDPKSHDLFRRVLRRVASERPDGAKDPTWAACSSPSPTVDQQAAAQQEGDSSEELP